MDPLAEAKQLFLDALALQEKGDLERAEGLYKKALALQLATTPKHLTDIKSKLAKNRNTFPLFNTDRFRRHIEAAYTTMWERYQRGEPPESFAVEPIDR